MIDSTIVRAHACAAGAPQGHLDIVQDQALGRSKGGFSTKIQSWLMRWETPWISS
ncbi:MAG: hypothetical protein GXP08_04580 [Gammaproteobacteria bacterium]|nr:hypothetical protein [Gammaproteobacteria bacterium]